MIAVLGPPRIERDGALVTFDTRKATALLGYLAVTARPQRRETLAALLWPDADETRARSALRRTLSVIRKELGDLGPRITREEVELVGEEDVAIDVQAFLADAGSDDVDEVFERGGPVAWRPPGRLHPPRLPRVRRLAGAGGRASAPGDVLSLCRGSSMLARPPASWPRPSSTPSDGWTSTRSTSRPTAR